LELMAPIVQAAFSSVGRSLFRWRLHILRIESKGYCY
jgi:hypothetical protein